MSCPRATWTSSIVWITQFSDPKEFSAWEGLARQTASLTEGR
jgi:hypothetical protein